MTAVLNNQQSDANGLPLTYFPVGTNPTWLAVNGAFAYTAEQGPAGGNNPNDPPQAIFIYNQSSDNGQLTPTQNTPLPTGATQLTYIYVTATIHLCTRCRSGRLDRVHPSLHGSSGGTLAAVSGAARANNAQGATPVFPSRMLKETTHTFIWVPTQGINTNQQHSPGA